MAKTTYQAIFLALGDDLDPSPWASDNRKAWQKWGDEQETIEDAWEVINNIGSTWFFYPIGCVIESCPLYTFMAEQIIISTPEGWEDLEGLAVREAVEKINEMGEEEQALRMGICPCCHCAR